MNTNRKRGDCTVTVALFESLTNTSLDAFLSFDMEGNITNCNAVALTMYGYSKNEFLTMSIQDIEAQENPEEVLQHQKKLVANGYDRFETRHYRKDKTIIDVEVSTTFVPEQQQIMTFCRDISDQKRVKDDLMESKELFALLMKFSPIYIFIKKIEEDRSRVIQLSENYIDMIGKPADELLGRTMEEIFPPDFARKITGDDIDVMNNCKVVRLDENLHDRHYITIKFPIIRESGEPLLAGYTIDVTDQKRSEELARQQAQLLNVTHDSIIVRDLDDRIIYWNDGAAKRYGISQDEALGKITHDLLQTQFPVPSETIIAQLHRDNLWEGELQHITRDGSRITVASRWVLQRDAAGKPVAILEINNDITQMKNAEKERDILQAQMFQRQKAESLGALAGGIAHDFNNILTAIIGNTELALMMVDPESPVVKNLRSIETSSRRAADLTSQMLAYSGKGRFIVEQIDLNRLLEEMSEILGSSITKKTSLRMNLVRPLRHIKADANQIKQIIINLVTNAAEALGDEVGEITVTTSQGMYDHETLLNLNLNEMIQAGFYVSLSVSDTGCGIDKETQAKIFDPFFSTKFTGRGLGMAAVLGILRGHQGAITVDSEPGKGTTFTMLLPTSDAVATTVNHAGTGVGSNGCGVVLVVDDEEKVCDIARQMLNILGYEVITAADGFEALEIYQQRSDISLVILDLIMPRMDGEETYNRLHAINPTVKVIIASGYSEQELENRFAGKKVNGLLQKPFTISGLKRALKFAYDGTSISANS
jgi:PAS domain S-box-containing protein